MSLRDTRQGVAEGSTGRPMPLFFRCRNARRPCSLVNGGHLNFVDERADFDLLLHGIGATRGAREFFNRG